MCSLRIIKLYVKGLISVKLGYHGEQDNSAMHNLRPYTFIAEVKTASPFGWRSARPWDELFELANRHGDMISVHTDPRWEGSLELVRKARRRTAKQILAKGIHADDEQIAAALEAGADKVLVVGRQPGARYLPHCLLEPRSLAELTTYPPDAQVVWNARNLDTGGAKPETFAQARAAWPGWLCQASRLRSIDDVQFGADAILVGSHLPEFIASLQ